MFITLHLSTLNFIYQIIIQLLGPLKQEKVIMAVFVLSALDICVLSADFVISSLIIFSR